jgi:hypothetical protein
MSIHARLVLFACGIVLSTGADARAQDQVLFNFKDPNSVKDWAVVALPEPKQKQPSPTFEIVDGPKDAGNNLAITFAGGDWPTIGTTKIPVAATWKQFQTIKAEFTVDRHSIAYLRIGQGTAADKAKQPYWEKTLNLLPGRNNVTLNIRRGLSMTVIDPAKGDITSFVVGMYQPTKGQKLLVGNVRLSPDWPEPKNVLGWYSPYNHDGYSSAVAREFQRTGQVTKFKVLGTNLEVADLPDLLKRSQEKWTPPADKSIEQIEADFRAAYTKLKAQHPRAVLAILRDGEKGWDPGQPDKTYAGWKMHYQNSHGPDGPNAGREKPQQLSETIEAFMRHRGVLMRVDLASIPKGSTILAARFVATRALAKDLKKAEKPNMWVAEPCNREWDPAAANCYYYAAGKHWKAVNGLYYGEDPDHWPVFMMHGPAGGGAVSDWDFAEALRFWLDGKHANHGFFLHCQNDYMRMYTTLAREEKQRPAVLVVYEPPQ